MKGRRILAYAGRLVHEKNIDFLLSAMTRIAPAMPDALLVLAGDGPYRTVLEHSVREHALEGHVLFTGFLDRKQMAWLFRRSEVFVFSSKTETQGLALAEAMMCGVPAVAVAAMGTEDILEGDAGGFLVPEDAGVFASRVIALLGDEGLRRAKAAQARERASRWTIGRTTDMLLAVYEQAIIRRSRSLSAP